MAFRATTPFKSRFEEGEGTNPEELIGAAHAGCFSMAFSNGLADAGFTPTSVETTAKVHLDKRDAGFTVTRIELETVGDVPGIDESTFQKIAEERQGELPDLPAARPGRRDHADRHAGLSRTSRAGAVRCVGSRTASARTSGNGAVAHNGRCAGRHES